MNNRQKKQLMTAVIAVVVLYFLYKMFTKKSTYTSPQGALSGGGGRTPAYATGQMTYGQFMYGGDGTNGVGWLATPYQDGLSIYKFDRKIPMKAPMGMTPYLEITQQGIAMLNGDRLPITIDNESNGPFRLTFSSDGKINQVGSSGVMGKI
jgi:hypothetical protein